MPTTAQWCSHVRPEFPREAKVFVAKTAWKTVIVTGKGWLPHFFAARTVDRDQTKLMVHKHQIKWAKP